MLHSVIHFSGFYLVPTVCVKHCAKVDWRNNDIDIEPFLQIDDPMEIRTVEWGQASKIQFESAL